MKAKLLVSMIIAMFSGNVFAEYYLVYPAYGSPCESCFQRSYKSKPHHYSTHKHKKTTHTAYHHRRRSPVITEYQPCGAQVHCSACGDYVDSHCGRPNYVVYSARARDCETYEGIEAGEQYSW